jgi:hypothetical protein
VALEVAGRSTEPARIEAALSAANRQTHFPNGLHWDPAGVAQGDAGLALLCAYVDACSPGQGWDFTAHGFLETAARAAERNGVRPTGLFTGLSGLAFVAWSLSRDGARYQRLLLELEDALLPQATRLAEALVGSEGVPVGDFDLISGLSGVGAYLLCRLDRPEVRAALEGVLSGLVALTRPGRATPAWYTPPALMADQGMAARYPTGNLNCGLAHGIPGPLALMSLALREGVEVPGLAESIRETSRWLIDQSFHDSWGVNWPTAVAIEPALEADGSAPPPEPSRAAWCYGSPGVARALWLAGEAVDDVSLRKLAVSAMEAVYRQPISYRRIDSPTFCHGVAGLLQITLRFAHDTRMPIFTEAAGALMAQLLASYDPDRVMGYFNLEPAGNAVDQPGLLDGAAGVPMVLLAAATAVEPSWDRLFLLS